MYIPLMIDLKKAVIFGGERGEGLQKTEKLAAFADEILVVPESNYAAEFIELKSGLQPHVYEKIELQHDRAIPVANFVASYENIATYVYGATLVVSDLNDRQINEAIFRCCVENNIPCNVIDTKELCTAWQMSLIDTPNMMAGISSKGTCAFYTKQTRIELQKEFDHRSKIAEILTELRNLLPADKRSAVLEKIYGDTELQSCFRNGEWSRATNRGRLLVEKMLN
ncbi:MAG: hypothetical protein GF398_09880 [Chitinivibrionales bacterium]|nr:hypothetical protein [Chitinivibrionales bacterium]